MTELAMNELQVLLFRIGENKFAVNVSKVSQILRLTKITKMPQSGESHAGVFNLRGGIVPLINLGKHLNIDYDMTANIYDLTNEEINKDNNGKILTLELNSKIFGFLVDEVDSIEKFMWSDLEKIKFLDDVNSDNNVVGALKKGEDIISLLDFEKILGKVGGMEMKEIEIESNPERNQKRLVIVDDSAFVRKTISDSLKNAGYLNIEEFIDGQQALERLNAKENDFPDLIVTDIEMPNLDGNALIQKLRELNKYKETPIVAFSSLFNETTMKEWKKSGADFALSKPDVKSLIEQIDEYVLK